MKQDFEFFGVPDSQINAFALPGGFIGVNTGLILLTQTESELASVLAHEISHVTQHHIARALAAQKGSARRADQGEGCAGRRRGRRYFLPRSRLSAAS